MALQEDTFFIDVSGSGGEVPPSLPTGLVGGHGLLGWTNADEVLVLDDYPAPDDTEADTELYWLTAVSLVRGEARRLSAVPGGENYGVGTCSSRVLCCRISRSAVPVRWIGGRGRRGCAWEPLCWAPGSRCSTQTVVRRVDRPSGSEELAMKADSRTASSS